jgi:cytochrome oxidase Cu insertion factor (SCO1/SenC/PrrC family)
MVRTCALCLALAAACAPAPSAAPAREVSLFALRGAWTDETGARTTLARWRGTPIVLAPIYTSCSQICPRTIAKLRAMHAAFAREGRAPEFVLVTLAPDADTPERLRAFKADEALPSSWHLLRGSPDDTRALLDALDVHVIDMGSHIVHEPRIAVFDAEGRLTRSVGDLDSTL